MEFNRDKLKSIASAAKNAAGTFADHAVHAVDQNDDGKFDLSDVRAAADSIKNAAQRGSQSIKATLDEQALERERRTLCPIFEHTLDEVDFAMSKFIRIVPRSKKYIESPVCQNSVGYLSDQKGFRFVNLFQDSVDSFNLSFYPDRDHEFYYADPTDRDQYIALDVYFGYLKMVRVNELQTIAQDLGATYFRVTYKEEQASSSQTKATAHVKAPANAEASQTAIQSNYANVHIAAEMECPGHAPISPRLRYMAKDPNIQTLIQLRMNETSPLHRQKYMLKMSHSCGMKESDAAKIDAVLHSLKVAGSFTVSSEIKTESHRYLEYEIEF